MKPRFLTDDTGRMVTLLSMLRQGSVSLSSCFLFPKMMNSVLDGFSARKLDDIQLETVKSSFCNEDVVLRNDDGKKEQ